MATIMKRTDVHRPSQINPADYQYVGATYLGSNQDAFEAYRYDIADLAAYMKRTGRKFSTHSHRGNCHCCGARALYMGVYLHVLSDQLIMLGSDCAAKLDMGGQFLRDKTARAEDAKAGWGKGRLLIAGHFRFSDDEANALITIARLGYYEKNFEALREAGKILRFPDICELHKHQSANYEVSRLVNRALDQYRILGDLITKLARYGGLSEKQLAFAERLISQLREPIDDQIKNALINKAACGDAPEGRLQIDGKVLTTKLQESRYGDMLRMLIELDSGAKVWGTVPGSIRAVEKGQRVRFTASFERSKDDRTFGTYKRPVNAEILQ